MVQNKIKEIRTKNYLSKTELAKICDVTCSTVSMWEGGQRGLDVKHAKLLSKTFGVTLDWLFGLDEDAVQVRVPSNKKSVTIVEKGEMPKTVVLKDKQYEEIKAILNKFESKD